MSGSRKKIERLSTQDEAIITRAMEKEQEEAKHLRTTRLYAMATVVLALIAAVAVFWNSGYIQSHTPAAIIDGEEISVGEFSYYYTVAMQTEMSNGYYYGTSGFNYNEDPATQMYDDTRTYHDFFIDEALTEIQSVRAILKAAEADGFTSDEDAIADSLAYSVSEMTAYAYTNGHNGAESYLQTNFGAYMSVELYGTIFRNEWIVTEYAEMLSANYQVTDDQIATYYDENSGALDSYTLDYMVLLANITDEESAEMSTPELIIALEEERVIQEDTANTIIAALEDGGDFAALAEEYDVYGAYEGDVYMGSNLNSSFADWVMDSDRQAGDMTVASYTSSDRHVYYVVRYVDRVRDDSATSSIRHIFISAGSAPSQEEYDAAYETAAELLAQWESGEATPESFGELATLYSADSSSASNGGVLLGVNPNSGYVDSFLDWCLDSSRQPGETGLVLNEDSSLKGWHVMYFDQWTGPQWELVAESNLLSQGMIDWYNSMLANTSAELASGTKYI